MRTLVNKEMLHCFEFFYDNFSRQEQTYGLMPDKIPDVKKRCSIAANGFMLAAMAVGADFGYISRDEAEQICLKTLKTCLTLQHDEGFFYHMYNMEDGSHFHSTEFSTIDSALLFCGALTAGGYFGGEVLALARKLNERCNWEAYYCEERNQFHMAKYDSGFSAYWDCYAEQLIMYFLAASSPHGKKIANQAYNGFARLHGRYADHTFIFSWFGSLFTHQYSHAFLDLRGKVDEDGVDWFENSVQATLANRQFCLDNSKQFKGYKDGWGLTSCSTKNGYKGNIGAPPSGNGNAEHIAEGTVAPCGALGSVVFTPELSLGALKHYYSLPSLVGQYGLKDAYNPDEDWYSDLYISIDKGITLLMLANHQKQTVWKSFGSLEEIQRAYKILKFKEV